MWQQCYHSQLPAQCAAAVNWQPVSQWCELQHYLSGPHIKLAWNTSSAQGATPLFRPIHCTASLLANATYTTVRLMYSFFWEIGTFYERLILRSDLQSRKYGYYFVTCPESTDCGNCLILGVKVLSTLYHSGHKASYHMQWSSIPLMGWYESSHWGMGPQLPNDYDGYIAYQNAHLTWIAPKKINQYKWRLQIRNRRQYWFHMT